MSTARAIQVSVLHISVGILVGSVLEALMPSHSASASVGVLAFESLAQVALNGVVLSQLGAQLNENDPTFGIPFSMGLFQSQPGLTQRLETVASAVKQQVTQSAQKMLPLAQEEERPNPH